MKFCVDCKHYITKFTNGFLWGEIQDQIPSPVDFNGCMRNIKVDKKLNLVNGCTTTRYTGSLLDCNLERNAVDTVGMCCDVGQFFVRNWSRV